MFILVVLGQPVNQQVIDGFGRFLMQKVPDPGYFPKVHTGRKILRARGELENSAPMHPSLLPVSASVGTGTLKPDRANCLNCWLHGSIGNNPRRPFLHQVSLGFRSPGQYLLGKSPARAPIAPQLADKSVIIETDHKIGQAAQLKNDIYHERRICLRFRRISSPKRPGCGTAMVVRLKSDRGKRCRPYR